MEVGDLLAAGLEQLLGGQGRTATGMADHHKGPVGWNLTGAALELRQGDQQAAGHSSIWSVEFLCGAHVEHGEVPQVSRHPGGGEFR